MNQLLKMFDQAQVYLTDQEINKCKEAFEIYDRNGSKRLEMDELRIAFIEMGHNLSDEELQELILDVDSTGDGAINFNDFTKIVALQKKMQEEYDDENINLAFEAMGGFPVQYSYIEKSKIAQIVKNDFQINIDIDKLMQGIEMNGSKIIVYQILIRNSKNLNNY